MAEQFVDMITVTAGEEKFSPVQYHSFSIGGFRYTTSIKPGETEEEAFKRAYGFLARMKKEHFQEERDAFYERLKMSRPTYQNIQEFAGEGSE